MYNNNGVGEVGPSCGSSNRWGRELRVDALSAGEWNYLRGLFLTDGYSHARLRSEGSRCYEVCFYFTGGEEEELARRVVGLLSRAGLNPHLSRHTRKNMVTVMVDSKALLRFLPDKAKLCIAEEGAVESFLEENKLFSVESGIPFLAGVLDGDGSCQALVEKVSCLGVLKPWNWSLEQSKLPFLVRYAERFVESLVPNGVRVRALGGRGTRNSTVRAAFRKSGILALLGAGIDKYSWKVERWSRRVDEARRERAQFLTTGQVARMLNVSHGVVVNWLRKGEMKYIRKSRARAKQDFSHYYIPAGEVELFRVKFLRGLEETARIKGGGVALIDVAMMLGVPRHTLLTWHQRGKLQATLIHERGQQGASRHLMIPREEVGRLKRKLTKPDDC